MSDLRIKIEGALDELVSNERGMCFQELAVALGKLRWPGLIASERKKDLGLDAYESSATAQNKIGKGLAASITANFAKIAKDANTAKRNFDDLEVLIFVTAGKVSNVKKRDWKEQISIDCGLDLVVISREDIINNLKLPKNQSLCEKFLSITVDDNPSQAKVIDCIRSACLDIASNWLSRTKDQYFVALESVEIDDRENGLDTSFSLADIQRILFDGHHILLEAPAGCGKTTTLAELARKVTSTGACGFLVNLPILTTSSEYSFLEYIAGRPSCQEHGLTTKRIAQVRSSNPFIFLLDGWNEVAKKYWDRAQNIVREIVRDFPSAGIIVTTRKYRTTPPLRKPVRLQLRKFSKAQRIEYMQRRIGDNARELQSRLYNSAVLDKLTLTPLLLSTVVSIFRRRKPIPRTTIGIIRLFANALEHRNELRHAPVNGFQDEYLKSLAMEMTEQGTVLLENYPARKNVHVVGQSLLTQGQQAILSQPAEVLAALTAHHVLERIDYPQVAFRFHHPLIQEYYAAIAIKEQLFEIVCNSNESKTEFAIQVVNKLVWDGSLCMLAEHLGSQDDHCINQSLKSRALRVLIKMAFSVNPIFAFELGWRCSDQYCGEEGGALTKHLVEWYKSNERGYSEETLASIIVDCTCALQDLLVPILASFEGHIRLDMLWPTQVCPILDWDQGRDEIINNMYGNATSVFVSRLLNREPKPEFVQFPIEKLSEDGIEQGIVALAWLQADDKTIEALENVDGDSFVHTVRIFFPSSEPDHIKERAVEWSGTAWTQFLTNGTR